MAPVFGILLQSGAGVIVAGTRVQGEVYADVPNEIRGAAWHVTVWGQEQTCVAYRETVSESSDGRAGSSANTTSRTETRYDQSTRSLLSIQIPVDHVNMIQNGKILPGKYRLPFSFDLPGSLPASLEFFANDGSAKIRYGIKAILKGSGMLWNYHCEQDLTVLARPMQDDDALHKKTTTTTTSKSIPYRAPPVSEQVDFCCCFHRGSMVFGAQVQDTHVPRGSPIDVRLSCSNQTTVPVQSVTAQLRQTIRWTSGGHAEQVTRDVAAADFTGMLGARLQRAHRLVPRHAPMHNEMQSILRDVEHGLHQQNLATPHDMLNSYEGALIRTQHELRIVVAMGCCMNDPSISVPLWLGEPSHAAASQTITVPPSAGAPAAATLPQDFWEEATAEAVIHVPSSAVFLGGVAVQGNQHESDIPMVTATLLETEPPSLDQLMEALDKSVSFGDVIDVKKTDALWMSFFQSLSPTQYGQVLRHVTTDFAQVGVAEALADAIQPFLCAHVAEALYNASAEWNRTTLVEKLLPYCQDVAERKDAIKSQLTNWELLVTERAFESASIV